MHDVMETCYLGVPNLGLELGLGLGLGLGIRSGSG